MRVPKGCPICRNDVLGSLDTGFFCKHCNLIFTKRHIVFEETRESVHSLIHKHFAGYENVAIASEERKAPRSDALDKASRKLEAHLEDMKRSVPSLKKAAQTLEKQEIDWKTINESLRKIEERSKREPIAQPKKAMPVNVRKAATKSPSGKSRT